MADGRPTGGKLRRAREDVFVEILKVRGVGPGEDAAAGVRSRLDLGGPAGVEFRGAKRAAGRDQVEE